MQLAFITIANGPFVAPAVALARSVRRIYPNSDMVLLWADSSAAPPIWLSREFTAIVRQNDLGNDGLSDMAYRYTISEYCCALKPWALRCLLDRFDAEIAVYLDADIYLYAPLGELLDAAHAGAEVILTPHICEPARGRHPVDELALLWSGNYNAGFIAVSDSPGARNFVDWFADILQDLGYCDREKNLYSDQKWLELTTAFVDRVAVLRSPGYNVAYWNAHQRPLARTDGKWSVSGESLKFGHFSQYSISQQNSGSYFTEYFKNCDYNYSILVKEYIDELLEISSNVAFVPKSSHSAPPACIRLAYAAGAPIILGDRRAVETAALEWLNSEARHWGRFEPYYITNLYDHIWHRRLDIRHNKFDINTYQGQREYIHWIANVGIHEENIPDEFIHPARAMIAADNQENDYNDTIGRELPHETITRLAAELSAREADLAAMSLSLSNREAEILSLIQSHDNKMITLNERIASRECECNKLINKVEQRDAIVSQLSEAVRERDIIVNRLDGSLAECESSLLKARLQLDAKDNHISSISTALEERNRQVEALTTVLGDIIQQAEDEERNLLQKIDEKRDEVSRLSIRLSAASARWAK